MVYDLCYGEYPGHSVLYDIEVYMNESTDERSKGLWNTEVHVGSCAAGIADYVFERIKDRETLEQFKKDCSELRDLRFWLWELHNNQYKEKQHAVDEHRDIVVPHVKEVIKKFCDKYDLWVNED